MILYMVRHGETDWNLQKRWQGMTDIPLNDTGRTQARAAREKISKLNLDACFCSPLSRAYEIAEIITNGLIEVQPHPLLIERSFGDYEGMLPDDEIALRLWTLNPNFTGDNVESLQDFLNRTQKFIDEMKASGLDRVLVVSHGGTSKGLHYNITGYNKNTDFFDWYIQNCEIVEVEI